MDAHASGCIHLIGICEFCWLCDLDLQSLEVSSISSTNSLLGGADDLPIWGKSSFLSIAQQGTV